MSSITPFRGLIFSMKEHKEKTEFKSSLILFNAFKLKKHMNKIFSILEPFFLLVISWFYAHGPGISHAPQLPIALL